MSCVPSSVGEFPSEEDDAGSRVFFRFLPNSVCAEEQGEEAEEVKVEEEEEEEGEEEEGVEGEEEEWEDVACWDKPAGTVGVLNMMF